MRHILFQVRYLLLLSLILFCSGPRSWAQSKSSSRGTSTQKDRLEGSIVELQKQLRELRLAVQEIHAEAMQYRAETLALQKQLDATRTQTASVAARPAAETSGTLEDQRASQSNTTEERINKLEEDQGLLTERVNEQNQTKVESASKYRVKLSGIVLFNLFDNQGRVDNIDFPNVAVARSGPDSSRSFGGTLRQSQLGLEGTGPIVAGAKTRADVQFDFSGGFPNNVNGISEGIVRLRTGTLRLDWRSTSLVAGQDGLFFAPLSPTSFASLSVPALSNSGNLWTWTPQVRVEHRTELSQNSSLLLQGGILDGFTGETPASEYFRQPNSGERSGQPAYAGRIAWSKNAFGRPLAIGAGGYYSRQNWGFARNVNSWAATSDWSLPLNRWLGLSGEFYRGRAVGGLGGGLGRSVVTSGPLSSQSTIVEGIASLGGWTQLKIRPTESKFEINIAGGQESPEAKDFRRFPLMQNPNPVLIRNRSIFANVIYRPKSDLVFSVEYRHLHTYALAGDSHSADHINTLMGFIF